MWQSRVRRLLVAEIQNPPPPPPPLRQEWFVIFTRYPMDTETWTVLTETYEELLEASARARPSTSSSTLTTMSTPYTYSNSSCRCRFTRIIESVVRGKRHKRWTVRPYKVSVGRLTNMLQYFQKDQLLRTRRTGDLGIRRR